MGTISSSELTAMRSTVDTLALPDTCYILRGTLVPDNQGGGSTTWSTIGTASCRLDMRSGNKTTTAGAIQPYSTYVLSLTHDQDILTADRVVYSGSAFNITSVNSGSWLGVKRAVLEKI